LVESLPDRRKGHIDQAANELVAPVDGALIRAGLTDARV
jgi:hypothetical protein